jgi:hypothetical protein
MAVTAKVGPKIVDGEEEHVRFAGALLTAGRLRREKWR